MTEAEAYMLLAPLADGQVYPFIAPQGVPAPYVVFILPSTQYDDVLSGQSASATSLQVDIYASSIDEARALRQQVRNLVESVSPVNLLELQDYEPDTKLYRATLEVQIWQ